MDKKLTPIQEYVCHQNGTERPFENEYWDNKKEGIYVDIISGEPLFSSQQKYDSGSGWPSFTIPLNQTEIKQNIDDSAGRRRIEVRSKSANSHLGHVFDDGPGATGKRYCINSAALKFIPKEDLEKEGYGKYRTLFDKSAIESSTELATFAAGCFWGVEHILKSIPGVLEAKSGYLGGSLKNPSYEDVCTGSTGHAEAVQIKYDPSIVSYETLLNYFWRLHDPTTLNRQGPDQGTQYRSAIFYHNEKQKQLSEKSMLEFNQSGVFAQPAVTKISSATTFYPAEEYHQNYFDKHKTNACHLLRDK